MMAKSVVEQRFPLLATAYRHVRDERRLLRSPKRTPWGFSLAGNRAMEDGTFESAEVEIFRKLIEHADVFIDVGANIGYYCLHALSKGRHTVAFEPIDANLRQLYRNISANGWEDDIEIFPIALGDRVGVTDIYGEGTGASLVQGWTGIPVNHRRSVPVSTADVILGHRFQRRQLLILVDIEGAELHMLHGAMSLVRREPKPMWMVEVSVTEHQPEGVRVNPQLGATFSLFWDNGYGAWTAEREPRRITVSEVKAVAEGAEHTLRTHNFLFLEEGSSQVL